MTDKDNPIYIGSPFDTGSNKRRNKITLLWNISSFLDVIFHLLFALAMIGLGFFMSVGAWVGLKKSYGESICKLKFERKFSCKDVKVKDDKEVRTHLLSGCGLVDIECACDGEDCYIYNEGKVKNGR